MKPNNKLYFALLIIGLIIIAGCSSPQNNTSSSNGGTKITVFKSATCGCCVGWIAELEKNGFEVEAIDVPDMSSIKQKYNIPRNMESCHTAVVGDYFIEGHVPIEAVNKLLEEQPDIDGIALPRMPAGSPGMPGAKKAPFKIYALSNGEISEFMTI
ncbi:MAG: DUF411 domain-containing protein [Nanoarchaeota archaeon]|nr:DUF411 domain-containing protein [Nanoarchaeota archaeon]